MVNLVKPLYIGICPTIFTNNEEMNSLPKDREELKRHCNVFGITDSPSGFQSQGS